MPLTPEEERELQQLQQEQMTLRRSLQAPPATAFAPGLTSPEEQEYQQLLQEQSQLQKQLAPTGAPPTRKPFSLKWLSPKAGADIAGLRPDASSALADLDTHIAKQRWKGVITSGFQRRAQPSLHSEGRAVDLAFPGQNMLQIARQLQQAGYAAHYERKGQVNPNGSVATGDHIHVSLRRRGKPLPPEKAPIMEQRSIAREYLASRAATPLTAPTPPPEPPKLKPTVTFKPSAAERASAEAEAAWKQRPSFAKMRGYQPAEGGPLQGLTDRRVAAVRAVLADPAWQELQKQGTTLRNQLPDLERRAKQPDARFQRDLAQWQANAAVVDKRRARLQHYTRLADQLGEKAYQLPPGKYRQEMAPARPGVFETLAEQPSITGAVARGLRAIPPYISSAAAGGEAAEQLRAQEYRRPDLALPPSPGRHQRRGRRRSGKKVNYLRLYSASLGRLPESHRRRWNNSLVHWGGRSSAATPSPSAAPSRKATAPRMGHRSLRGNGSCTPRS